MTTEARVDEVLKWIRRRKVDTFSLRDAYSSMSGRKWVTNVDDVRPVLDEIVSRGHLRRVDSRIPGRPGRPTERFEIVTDGKDTIQPPVAGQHRQKDLLTIAEFCAWVQISTRTFRHWNKKGIAPRQISLRGQKRIMWKDAIEWLESNYVDSPGEKPPQARPDRSADDLPGQSGTLTDSWSAPPGYVSPGRGLDSPPDAPGGEPVTKSTTTPSSTPKRSSSTKPGGLTDRAVYGLAVARLAASDHPAADAALRSLMALIVDP